MNQSFHRLRLLPILAGVLIGASPAPCSAQSATAQRLVGTVRSDSADRPIAGATIALTGLGLRAQSDSAGYFAFPSRISAGVVQVRVVALGFEPIETTLDLGQADSLAVDFVLSRVVQGLAAVRISDRRPDRTLPDFERRRASEPGRFFEEPSIRQHARAGRLSGLIAAVSGLRLVTPPRGTVGTEQYVVGGRGSEYRRSGLSACYSAVVLDGVWVYSGLPGQPLFNINGIPAESVRAVEIYRSTAEIPAEFNKTGNFCGLVVIWLK